MKETGIIALLSAYFPRNYMVLQVLAERPTQIYRTTGRYLRSNYIRTNAVVVHCADLANITESQDSQLGCLLDRALGIWRESVLQVRVHRSDHRQVDCPK